MTTKDKDLEKILKTMTKYKVEEYEFGGGKIKLSPLAFTAKTKTTKSAGVGTSDDDDLFYSATLKPKGSK